MAGATVGVISGVPVAVGGPTMSLSVSSDSSHAASTSNLNRSANPPDADPQPNAPATAAGGPAASADSVSISAGARSANAWPSLTEGQPSPNIVTSPVPGTPASSAAGGLDTGQAQQASNAVSRQIEFQPQAAMLTQAHGVPATVMALLGN